MTTGPLTIPRAIIASHRHALAVADGTVASELPAPTRPGQTTGEALVLVAGPRTTAAPRHHLPRWALWVLGGLALAGAVAVLRAALK